MKKNKIELSDIFDNFVNIFSDKYIVAIAFFLIVGFMFFPKSSTTFYNLRVGDVAPKTIRSTVSMLVEDKEATKRKIEEAIRTLPPIFDYDSSEINNTVKSIKKALDAIDKAKPDLSMGKFFKTLGLKPHKSLYLRILRYKKEVLFSYAKVALDALNDYYIVPSTKQLYKFTSNTVIVRDIKNPKDEKTLNKNDIIDIPRAKIIAYNKLKSITEDISLRNTVWDFISDLILPNLTFNSLETKKRQEEEVKKINHVFFKISKGEIIVRSGDIITTTDYLKLNALNSIKQKENVYEKSLAKLIIFIIIALILYKSYILSRAKKNKILRENIIILILSSLIIFELLIFKLFSYITSLVTYSSPDFPKTALIFGIPYVFAPIMTALLVDFELAFLVSILTSISAWLIVDSTINSYLILYMFVGSVISIVGILKEKTRAGIIKSGLYASLSNMVIIVIFYMFNGNELGKSMVFDLSFGVLSGVLSSITVSGVLPVFEYVFNVTTDIKLLELGNLNNPLLKELALKAPGTYHHSIVVSSLAEAAASAIGANSLIAKVGSYYHDIGKVQKPMYFVENQTEGINPHDKIRPSISALIIKNHVKYGLDIAKKHRLGSYIMDIITQHHGTSLIKYFYVKAKESGSNPKEEDFRYPGPKPQTKESGIVMIADEVEAASKTLSNPTVAHLTEFVREITNKIFLDGQLDECELTLKDLNAIVDSFVKVLVGIFHHRIEYPEEEKDANNNNK